MTHPMLLEEIEKCTNYEKFEIRLRVGDLFKQTVTLASHRGSRLKVQENMVSFEDISREYALMEPGRGPLVWAPVNRVYEIQQIK